MRRRKLTIAGEATAADALPGHDYVDAFEVSPANADERSAEAWMRAIFEGGPRPMRLFLLMGWRVALGFRSGPRPSAAHVLGWKITEAAPEVVLLEQHSSLMTTYLMLRVTERSVVWTTHVRYENRAAPAVWAVVGLIHRRVIPYLLRHATSQPAG